MGLVCSTCGHNQAGYACKCNGDISFLGDCCLLKHLKTSGKLHEQLPLEHSFQFNMHESNDISPEDSAYISELTESLFEYKHTLRNLRDQLLDYKIKVIKAVESSVDKSLSFLNLIEFDFIKKSIALEDFLNFNNSEGRMLFEKFKKQRLAGVLDKFPISLYIAENEVIQSICNGIAILDPGSIKDRFKIPTVKSIAERLDKLFLEIHTFDKHTSLDSTESEKIIDQLNRQIAHERAEFRIIKEKNALEIGEKDRQIHECKELIAEIKNQMAQKEEFYIKERVEYTKQINDLKDHLLEAKKTLIQDNFKYKTEIAERNRVISQYQKDLNDVKDNLEKDHTKLFVVIEGQDGEIKKLKNVIEQLKIENQQALADIKAKHLTNIDLKENFVALQAKTAQIEELKSRLSEKEVWYEKQIDLRNLEISENKEYIAKLKKESTEKQTRYIKELCRIKTNLVGVIDSEIEMQTTLSSQVACHQT